MLVALLWTLAPLSEADDTNLVATFWAFATLVSDVLTDDASEALLEVIFCVLCAFDFYVEVLGQKAGFFNQFFNFLLEFCKLSFFVSLKNDFWLYNLNFLQEAFNHVLRKLRVVLIVRLVFKKRFLQSLKNFNTCHWLFGHLFINSS